MIETLSDAEAVEAALTAAGPTWLFKHSNACGVSSGAYAAVRDYAAAHPEERIAMIVIQEQRALSNRVAEATGYIHQSPQLFLLAGGAVRWHASHWSITAAAMTQARAALGG